MQIPNPNTSQKKNVPRTDSDLKNAHWMISEVNHQEN